MRSTNASIAATGLAGLGVWWLVALTSASPTQVTTAHPPVSGAVAPLRLSATHAWPPRPERIVNINSANFATGHWLSVPAGGEHVVYSVPSNQWLVITDWYAISSLDQGGPTVVERLSAVDTVKLNADEPVYGMNSGLPKPKPVSFSGGPVGLVFQPGSSVLILNTDIGQPRYFSFDLVGYLIDA